MDEVMRHLRPKMSRPDIAFAQEWGQKRWLWVLDTQIGCRPAYIVDDDDLIKKDGGDGNKIKVRFADDGSSEALVSTEETEAMNPPKYDKIEDMAELSHLNESSVLHNLRERYYSNLVYTYSGLFLVVVNPWKRLPLYTPEIVEMYKGKRRNELPPHIYAVCDMAYRNMVMNRENQSILVTGESGAGKTENTKKVIQYFAAVSGTAAGHKSTGEIEMQLIQANPILEAFGNAKTRRNNNSSRFGKFIRIEFGPEGSIVGAHVETYLLEKSRVVRHDKQERTFHIFYQMLEGATMDMRKRYFLEDVRSYRFLQGSSAAVDGTDNAEEFRELLRAMDVMLFSERERDFIFRIVSAVLLLGNLKFTCSSRDDAAQIQDATVADKIAHLLGIQSGDLIRSILKPQVKASKDWVTVAVNVENAYYSVEAVAKAIYERLFRWVVSKINEVLETKKSVSNFIGVLDIAGFEIFDTNSFEQLCINYTNEKLQQFFNHHMFILEQEEYRKENIDWKFRDFGLDLEPTISLIEKSLGIFSILDEQCLFPKATDQTFIDKLHETLDGKTTIYKRFQLYPKNFQIAHYAGDVVYLTEGWLEKNKDPVNENLMQLLSKSIDPTIAKLFEDYVDFGGDGTIRRTKGSRFITVSQRHKQQLVNLMSLLSSTNPHFVRCILPNEQKKPGLMDAPLVLDQLRCNGVIEGIRISREGFPSRILFSDFRQRYEILRAHAIPPGFFDSKKAAQLLVEALNINPLDYRMGISKIFFKQGCVAELEEQRDRRLTEIMTILQARGRGMLARRDFRRKHFREDAIRIIQRNARVYIKLRQWPWWRLYSKVKPLLAVHRQEEQERALKSALGQLEELLKREQAERARLERLSSELRRERNDLDKELGTVKGAYEDTVQSLNWLEEKRDELEKMIKEFEVKIDHLEASNTNMEDANQKLTVELTDLNGQFQKKSDEHHQLFVGQQQLASSLKHLEDEVHSRGSSIETLVGERDALKSRLFDLEQQFNRESSEKLQLTQQKRHLEDQRDDLTRQLEQLHQLEMEKRKQDEMVNRLEEQVARLRRDYQTTNESLDERNTSLSQLQSTLSLSTSKSEVLESSNRQLVRDMEEISMKLEAEQAHRVKLEKSKQILENELQKTTEEFDRLNTSLLAAKEEKHRTDRELDRIQRELSSTLEQSKISAEQERAHFDSELQMCQQEIDIQQANQRKLRKEHEVLSIENAELTTKIEVLERARQQWETARARLDSQLASMREFERKSAQEDIVHRELQNAKLGLQADLERAHQRIVNLEQSLVQLRQTNEQTVSDLQDQLDELRRRKSALERDKNTMEVEFHEIQTRIETIEAEKTQLALMLDTTRQELRALQLTHDHQMNEALREVKHQHALELEQLTQAQQMTLSNLGQADQAKQDLRRQISELSSSFDGERTKSLELDRRHRRAEEELQRVKQHLESLIRSSEDKDQEINLLKTRLLAADTKASERESEIESLKRVRHSLETQLERVTGDVQQKETELSGLVNEQRALKSQLEDALERVVLQQQQMDEFSHAKSRSDQSVQEITLRYRTELNEKNEELFELRRDLEKQITELNLRLNEEMRANQHSARQKRELETRLTDLTVKHEMNAQYKTEFYEYRRTTEAQIRQLQMELDRERDAKRQTTETLCLIEKKKSELEQRVSTITTESNNLRRVLTVAETERSSLKDSLEQITHVRDTLIHSKKTQEQELTRLSQSLRELELRNDQLEFEKGQHARDLELVRQSLNSDFDQKLLQIEESKRVADREVTSLMTRIDDQSRELTSLQQSRSLLEDSFREIKARLDTEVQAKAEATMDKRKALQELMSLRGQLDTELIARSSLEHSVKRQETELATIRTRLHEEESERTRISNVEVDLRGELTRLQTISSDQLKIRSELEEENRRLEAELGHLRDEIKQSSMEVNELRHSRQAQQEIAGELRMKFDKEMSEKNARLETIQAQSKREMDELREKFERETTRNLRLREQNALLEKESREFREALEKETRIANESRHVQLRLEAKLIELTRLYELSQHAEKSLEVKYRETSNELNLLHSQQDHERDVRNSLDRAANELRTQIEDHRRTTLEAEKGYSELDRKFQQALQATQEWQGRFNQENDLCVNLQSKVHQLQKLLVEVQAQADTESQAKQSLELTRSSLDREIYGLRARISSLETNDISLAKHNLSQLETQVNELKVQLDGELVIKREWLREKQILETNLIDLQNQLKDSQMAFDRSRTHLSSSEAQMEELRTQLSQYMSRGTDLETDALKAERSLIVEQERALALEKENERLRSQFQSALKEIESLENRMVTLEGEEARVRGR